MQLFVKIKKRQRWDRFLLINRKHPKPTPLTSVGRMEGDRKDCQKQINGNKTEKSKIFQL